jgi:hypothetical protein
MLKSKKLSRSRVVDRDTQFLAFILKLYKHATVLTLTKLAYLVDYLQFEKTDRRISGLNYRLYSFGPFDESVYSNLEDLVLKNIISSHLNYTKAGLEYLTYAFNDAVNDLKFKNEFLPELSIVEFHNIRDILLDLFFYDEKRLTKMIYNSKPVQALGITSPEDAGVCGQILSFC